MHTALSRRSFIHSGFKSCAAVAAAGLINPAGLAAGESFQRKGAARFALSLAAYSFRDFFKDASHRRDKKPDPSQAIDMFQFIDYCAEHGCAGAEVTSYYFPESVTDEYLLKLKRHAFLRGVEISGTSVGNTFTFPAGEQREREIKLVKRWIDHAQTIGAPHLRVFAGEVKGTSKDEAKKLCLEALEECGEYAGSKGVMLGIENHGGIVAEAETLLEIIQTVKSPWIGINLDTANFHTKDPYADLAKCAPHAVNVQMKTEVRAQGGRTEPADLRRLFQILRDASYQGYIVLEYEAAEDPWQAVPRTLEQMKKSMAA